MLTEANDIKDQIMAGTALAMDVTFVLPNSDRDAEAEYLAEHLPGAVFFDINAIAEPNAALPHTMPDADSFTGMMRALGVNQHQHLVLYDQSGFLSSARAWWMFRYFGHHNVSILNGGIKAWKAAGGLTEQGKTQPEAGNFTASPTLDGLRVVPLDEMIALVTADAANRPTQIVDARAKGRFDGTSPEPRPGMASGHMPGAINCPIGSLLDADTGRVKSRDALEQIFADAGIAMDQPIVTTCGSGVTACGLAFGMALLGKTDVAIYDGSWTEWGSPERDRALCPVETSELGK